MAPPGAQGPHPSLRLGRSATLPAAAARRDVRAGFTLIEALVALVVLSLVMLAAMRGFAAARNGLDRAMSSAAAETVARSILETQLDLLAAAPGEMRGATDGVDWLVTADPLPLPPPPPAAPPAGRSAGDASPGEGGAEPQARWRPLRVRVTVSNGRGRPLTFETVHLAAER